MNLKSLRSWLKNCGVANEVPASIYMQKLRAAAKELGRVQAEIKELEKFLNEWDGHESNCGRNREGFEGCDERMFDCSCGYEEAKREALKEPTNAKP